MLLAQWISYVVLLSRVDGAEAVFGNIGASLVQGLKDLFWGAVNGVKNLFVDLLTGIAASVQYFFEDTLSEILYAIESAGKALEDHTEDTVHDLVGGFQEDQDKLTQLLLKLAEKGELPLKYYEHTLDLDSEFDFIDQSLVGVETFGATLLTILGIIILFWIGAAFGISAAENAVKEWGIKLDEEKKIRKKNAKRKERAKKRHKPNPKQKKNTKKPSDYIVHME